MDSSWAFLQVLEERCTLCGLCLSACPRGALTMGEKRAELAQPEACGGCGECEQTCPEEAIHCAFEIVWEADLSSEGGPHA